MHSTTVLVGWLLNIEVSNYPVESLAQPARASTGRHAYPPNQMEVKVSWLHAVYCYLGHKKDQTAAHLPLPYPVAAALNGKQGKPR